MSTENEFRMI